MKKDVLKNLTEKMIKISFPHHIYTDDCNY